jgi:MFS superfamily sulfate permease-like transporter
MLGLVLLSLIIGFAVTDSSLRIDTVKNLYKDTQPKLTDLLSYLTAPFLAASSFRLIHLAESLKLACLIYLESLFTLNFSEKECSDTGIEPQREVLALAIANILSGVFCGIPVSAGLFSTTINGVLIRKASKYPRLTSLIFTISMELFVVFFSIQIPYLAFATVLIGAALFTL